MSGALPDPMLSLPHLTTKHHRHFVTDPQLHPGLAHQCLTQTKPLTQLRDVKFADDTTSANAQEAMSASLPTSVGTPGAREHTLVGGAPTSKNELTGAHTPLRHSQFERELANHPDKAWVSRLLTGIDMGVDIGYKGPRGPQDSPNLSSAYQHPNQNCKRNWMLGECRAHSLLDQCHPFAVPASEWCPRKATSGA